MTGTLDRFRDRLPESVKTAAVSAGVAALLGNPLTEVAAVAAAVTLGFVALTALGVERGALAPDPPLSTALGGAVSLVVGGLLFTGGRSVLGAGFLAAGGWSLLDAVQSARHGVPPADDAESTRKAHEHTAERLHERIRERPRTRRELRAESTADPAAVDAALHTLRERSAVRKRGAEFHDAPEPGWHERGRKWLSGVARRIARPVALEFDGTDRERSKCSETDEFPSATDSIPVANPDATGGVPDTDSPVGRDENEQTDLQYDTT